MQKVKIKAQSGNTHKNFLYTFFPRKLLKKINRSFSITFFHFDLIRTSGKKKK